MSKEKLIPELRFPEFKNEGKWEKKKCSYYLELLTDFEANGSFADVKENVTVYDSPSYAWYVRATDLEKGNTIDNIKFVDQKSYNFLRKTSLFGGELLITKRGEIGKVYFFKPKNGMPATVAPNLYLLKMNGYAIPKFFFYYFTTPNGNSGLKRLNASSTIGALYKDDVKNILLLSPKIDEQKKIASCLSSLDEVIAAYNQKLDLLKNHKKGLMQNLFPQEGETVPKVRFKQFENEGEWVEKKLEDILQFQTGFPFDSEGFNDEGRGVRLIKNRDLKSDDKIVYYSKTYDEKYLVSNGDILVGMDGDFTPIRWDKGTALLNQRVGRVLSNKKGDELFFLYFLTIHLKAIEEKTARTTVKHLSHFVLEKINQPLPKSQEQQKIASCLSSLDALITAQAEKIAQLKLHKKGLMQEMFPKIND